MSSERSGRPEQRFSRFTRSIYEDIVPPRPPEDVSLAEIAARALNKDRETPTMGRAIPSEAGIRDQPPPPEPSPYWAEVAQPAPAPTPAATPAPRPAETLRPAFGREAPPSQPLPSPPKQTPASAERREGPVNQQPKPAAAVSAPIPSEPPEPGLAAKTWAAAREKAGPALVKSAFWLAHNLRRREIRKRYNKAVVFGHTRVVDRKLESLFFVPTLQAQVINPAPDRGIHYDGPVPAVVFDWVMTMVPDDLRQFAFIDIRAGRGRTSLLAAKRNFQRILAYEWSEPLFEDLRMNIAQFPRSLMTCRNIDCHRGDVDGISLPDQPCVIYFSGAWQEKMIPGVMKYAAQTYQQSPRRIYVILENVDEATGIEGEGIFQKVEPALAERLKLRLLSPMDFRVYRSIA